MKRSAIAAIATIAAALFAACGAAQPDITPEIPRIDVENIGMWITTGDRILPIYFVDSRYYLLGEKGGRYEIVLANPTDARLEMVVSVDGRDVITGREADYRQNRGYVLMPGEEISIEGFRRSLDEVATFEFSAPNESYAGRLGDQANIGVIGIAVFNEDPVKAKKVIAGGREPASKPEASAKSGAEIAINETEQGLGTKYGENVDSVAEIVPFRRRTKEEPLEIIALYYSDREGLERIGVVFDDPPQKRDVSDEPNPFPGVTDDQDGFAPPPSSR